MDELDWEHGSKGLTATMVLEGKQKELQHMKNFGIYVPRPRAEVPKDYKHISTRWEVQKRTDSSGEVLARVRFVSREFRRGDPRNDIFAAASSSVTSRLIPLKAMSKPGMVTFTLDASSAFFHAPCLGKCVVDPPAEWLEQWVRDGGSPETVWELRRELYGRRVAPCRWTEWFANELVALGMQQSPEARGSSTTPPGT